MTRCVPDRGMGNFKYAQSWQVRDTEFGYNETSWLFRGIWRSVSDFLFVVIVKILSLIDLYHCNQEQL